MVCMQLYAKEIDSPPGASAAASIFSRSFSIQGCTPCRNSETKDLIWKLCAWRDLMARIHDESLRYVLSDQAIVALSANVPSNPTEVFDVILQADSSSGASSLYPSLSSPSLIVKTHVNELCYLLQEANADISNVFRRYLQKCMGSTDCCPLSIYSYALLSDLSLKETTTLFPKQNGGKFTVPAGKRASRKLFVQKFSCKSPVYHNCRIYASDGRLLCYCDQRKLEWYVQRDLAKIVEEDPPAIMLLFEPKGRPEDEDNDFYIQSKKNLCVGCGEKSHYLRYRIIPSCYRMHFPEHLKSHRSHDIVLLCVDCHEVAHAAAEKYKRQIAVEFGIPLFVRKIVDAGENKGPNEISGTLSEVEETGVSPLQLRTAAMALLRHGSSMPSRRHDELMQIVKAYFGRREISLEDLELALLVGMSPHEIRRLEKKKGFTFKHYQRSNLHSSTVVETFDATKLNNNSQGLSNDTSVTEASIYDIDVGPLHDEDTSHVGNEKKCDEREALRIERICILNNFTGNGDPSQGNGTCKVPSAKSAKKLSLLGHGPHGKQIVEHLLNNYGEDGIQQFCQRWRQVFVEAIHPRFLPSGWDIMHSGRRDFGEYSVYNPAKKVPCSEGG